MQRNDLCNQLRQEYSEATGMGVARVDHPQYHNLWFVVPPSPPISLSKKLPLKALSRANVILNKLPDASLPDPLDRLISYLFIRQEALVSSRMEGTWSTIDSILTPVSKEDETNQVSATAAIRGYAEALEQNFSYVQKLRYKAFTTSFVCNLHKMIVSKDPNFYGKPGVPRQPGEPGSIVHIGGFGRKENSIYNPAPPQHVKRCFKEIMAWFQNNLLVEMGDAGIGGLPLTLRLAMGHVHFEAVHPFSDGNGRVGRMLWPFQMILADHTPLYLSGFIESEKQSYNETLSIAQKKLNYNPFIEFMCESIVESYEESQRTKTSLVRLEETWKERGSFRQGSAAELALQVLIGSPIITVKELSRQVNVSFQAGSTVLKRLRSAGIVSERTGFERNRIYAAEEVIAILGRRFGESPDFALKAARDLLLSNSK